MVQDSADGEDIHNSSPVVLNDMQHGTTGDGANQVDGLKNSKATIFNKDEQADYNHWSTDGVTAPLEVANITVEAVTKRVTDHRTGNTVCQLGKTTGQSYGLNSNYTGTNLNKMGFHFHNGAWRDCLDPDTYDIDKWYYFAGSFDEAILKLYRNAALANSTVYAGSLNYTATHRWNFGVYSLTYSTWTAFLQGTISEVRVSNVARAAEWTKATYHSLFDSLLIFDATGPEGAPSIPPFTPDASDTYTPFQATKLTVDGDVYENNGPAIAAEHWYDTIGPLPNIPSAWHILADPLEQDTTWDVQGALTKALAWHVQNAMEQDFSWTIIGQLFQDTGWNIFPSAVGFIQMFFLKPVCYDVEVESTNAPCHVDDPQGTFEMEYVKSSYEIKEEIKDTFEITRIINDNLFIV